SGDVLIAGGLANIIDDYLPTAQIYSPSTGTWSATTSMVQSRAYSTLTLLANGHVLAAGGRGSPGPYLKTAELYDPQLGQWTATEDMAKARDLLTATALPDGRLLIAGGLPAGPIAEAELFVPRAKDADCAAGGMCVSGKCVNAKCCEATDPIGAACSDS